MDRVHGWGREKVKGEGGESEEGYVRLTIFLGRKTEAVIRRGRAPGPPTKQIAHSWTKTRLQTLIKLP